MKNIFYIITILILVSCRESSEEGSVAAPTLIQTELSRKEEFLKSELDILFGKYTDAYKRDKNSVKAYFDKTRYLNKLSNDLRWLFREKSETIKAGRAAGEGDWKELDKQLKEYVRKLKIIVKQPENHSPETREIAEREMAFLLPAETWYNTLGAGKDAEQQQLFLASAVNNIYEAEIAVSNAIYSDMHGERNSFEFFQLSASPATIEVKAGEKSQVELYIQAVNKGLSPSFVIGNYDLKRDTIVEVTDNKSITYSNGKGVFTINDQRLGDHEIEIIAIMKDPASGKTIHIPLTYKYKVIK
jgi:hypothetical protein